MPSGNPGEVTGRSLEVYAPNAPQAVFSARVSATIAGFRVGELLYWEQVAAGLWEVVFKDEGMLHDVPALELAEATSFKAYSADLARWADSGLEDQE